MNFEDKRLQIAALLKQNDPENAKNVALELLTSEPDEPANYKNLAICFAALKEPERALATLTMGKNKSNATVFFWGDSTCEVLRYLERFDELTISVLEVINDPKVGTDEKVQIFRTHIHVLQLAIVEKFVSDLPARFDSDAPILVELAYFFHEQDAWERAKQLSTLFSGDSNLDYVGKKRLSLVCGHTADTARAMALLKDIVNEAPSDEYHQNDLLEIAKIYATKQPSVDEGIATLDKAINQYPELAEAHRLKAYWIHYSDNFDLAQIKYHSLAYGDLVRRSNTLIQKVPRLEKKIPKVGFLSASFKMHPVGWMTAGFFCETKNFKDICEIHILATAIGDDFISKTIRSSENFFYDLSDASQDDLTNIISDLDLDILVDLEGLGVNHKIDTILKKPAPILIKWVGGLIGSMWLPEYDYLVTDEKQTPKDNDSDFSEKLIKMPGSYVTYSPPPYKIEQRECPFNLKGFITFGSFNNICKLSPVCCDAWASILKAVPDSQIVFKDHTLGDIGTQQSLAKLMKERGINSDRIHILTPTQHGEHLQHIQLADIALDPFPYTGGLCTIEAAYMGVPVIALAGRLLSHRHSTTHLLSMGHPELVASSIDEYIKIAIDLAKDKQRITKYRHDLRSDLLSSSLLKHSEFTEVLLKKMAALVC